MIIAILNKKGGTGKSTLTVNIAHQLQVWGKKLLLIDADPQKSAIDWYSANEGKVLPVVSVDRPTIGKSIAAISLGYEFIFIDCPSGISTDERSVSTINDISIAVLKCADVILVPLQAGAYDEWSTVSLLEFIREIQRMRDGKPKVALIATRQIKNTNLCKNFRTVLQETNFPVFKSETCNRVAYASCIKSGQTVIDTDTVGDAKREIEEISKELLEFIK